MGDSVQDYIFALKLEKEAKRKASHWQPFCSLRILETNGGEY